MVAAVKDLKVMTTLAKDNEKWNEQYSKGGPGNKLTSLKSKRKRGGGTVLDAEAHEWLLYVGPMHWMASSRGGDTRNRLGGRGCQTLRNVHCVRRKLHELHQTFIFIIATIALHSSLNTTLQQHITLL